MYPKLSLEISMRRLSNLALVAGSIAGPSAGCYGGDRTAPDPASLEIAQAPTNSGNGQLGVGGVLLPNDLRVIVTRDGVPVEGVTVYWRTSDGSVSPTSAPTDANGISATSWTLAFLLAEQIVRATLDDITREPDVAFTARSIPGPAHGTLIQVLTEGGNRFEPADVTIPLGGRVNWYWPPGSSGHNVVPDNGDSPPHTGPLETGPMTHSFIFTVPGVYRYYCMAHGGIGGVGMSGTVTVLASELLVR
jgi:plastocyanin